MTSRRPKVFLAWDGSPASTAGLGAAGKVADQLQAELLVLHVWRNADEQRQDGGRLESEARQLGMNFLSSVGDAAAEIIRVCDQPDTLLVILTTHGREIEPDHRLGSVASRIVAETTEPVLIVNPEAANAAEPRPLKRLLVPVDGAPSTAAALTPVTELAAALGGSVDMLYVASGEPPNEHGTMVGPRYVDQPQHEWPAWAEEITHRLARVCASCPPEVPVNAYLACGEIGEEITRFAEAHDSDAIVLVRRSRFQPNRAKVIRSVLRQTTCSLLIVGGEKTSSGSAQWR